MARDIAEAIGCGAHRRHSAMLWVPGIAVLGVSGGRSAAVAIDVRGVGGVALTQLVGLCVHGQGIGVVRGLVSAATLKERAKEAGLLAVAGGVVVGGRGAEALLLLAMAAKSELGQGGDDEEDAASVFWLVSSLR